MSLTKSQLAQQRRLIPYELTNPSLVCALFIGICLAEIPVIGGETDPYTNRELDLDDSIEVLDAKVNEALDRIASNWSRGCNERAFIYAVYRDLGGLHWVDKIERWAMFAPEIDRLPRNRAESVFADAPIIRSSGARLGNFTRTINVNGTYISTDKLGHFFSQGRKFYSRYQRLGTEVKAARLTARWEGLIWGNLLSGIYSNADLIANYEGFLFYRGLLYEGDDEDQDTIFVCREGNLVKLRDFTWAEHVNGFWDEMLNPSYFKRSLVPAIEQRMLRLCSDYSRRPRRYEIQNSEELNARYRAIAMRDSSVLPISQFLDENCSSSQTSGLEDEDLS